jgi:DNA-binding NarL/FixJ family response regulator
MSEPGGLGGVGGKAGTMPATVLLVDDDRLARLRLRIELEAVGYRVVDEASDGYGAIALAATHEPDFVILDQLMPMLDGSDAIPAIRSVSPGSRVIVHTAVASEDLEHHARAQGAAGYVDKVRPLQELVELLGELA